MKRNKRNTGDGNKVFYGLSNVHYALLKDDSMSGNPSFEAPIPILGAVGFSPSPDNADGSFFADNRNYFSASKNNGYAGDLEMAKFPDEFLASVLGWEIDKNGALIEISDGMTREFALLFEIDGDKKGRRNVFYCCAGNAPTQDYKTTGNSIEPTVQKMGIKATPLVFEALDGKAIPKASIEYGVADKAWANFFTEVYMPDMDITEPKVNGGI